MLYVLRVSIRKTEQLPKKLFKALPLVTVELKHFSLQGYSSVGLHSLNPGKAFCHRIHPERDQETFFFLTC